MAKNKFVDEDDEDLASELQDQVFDFEESEALLDRADRWLNDDSKSTTTNGSGDRTYIDRNKKHAKSHTKYKRPMKCEILSDKQKERLMIMMDDITGNIQDLKRQKDEYYKPESSQSAISKFSGDNMYSVQGDSSNKLYAIDDRLRELNPVDADIAMSV